MANPTRCDQAGRMPAWLMTLGEMQERGLGSVALLLATALSLGLANSAALSPAWLRFWATPVRRRRALSSRALAAARGYEAEPPSPLLSRSPPPFRAPPLQGRAARRGPRALAARPAELARR